MARSGAVDDVDLTRDRALVHLAQDGDRAAFAELYSRYFRRLVRFSIKRVGDAHEAEEIAQEAFARAYRALPGFAGERRFYPWMTVIASRLCVDALRRRGRVELGEVAELEFTEPGFERLDREGDLLRLDQAMDRLIDRHRQVLDLRERRGWSYDHIAEHYQVSVGTVEALLWRARRALRREFIALGSALVGVPGLRRLLVRPSGATGSSLAALGSVGTVVALSLGTWGVAGATAAPAAPARATTAAASPTPDPSGHPPVASALRSPANAQRPTAGAPRPSVGSAHPSTSERSGGSENGTGAAPGPRIVRFMSPSGAAQAARSQPVVVAAGPAGPVVGLNPVVVVHHLRGGRP